MPAGWQLGTELFVNMCVCRRGRLFPPASWSQAPHGPGDSEGFMLMLAGNAMSSSCSTGDLGQYTPLFQFVAYFNFIFFEKKYSSFIYPPFWP